MSPAVRTDRTDCQCGARVIKARVAGWPMTFDWRPAPWGTWAVRHEATGAWRARRLGQQEGPLPPEKRHAVHECAQEAPP